MKNVLFAMLVTVLCALTAGSPALAATYHISATGEAPGNGTELKPWTTFTASVPALVEGDVVVVAPGVYKGPIELFARDADGRETNLNGGEQGIVFRSREPWAAVIEEGAPDTGPKPLPLMHLGRAQNVTLEGFFFRRRTRVKGSTGLTGGEAKVTVRDCKFERLYTAIAFLRRFDRLIERNLFAKTSVGCYLGRRGGTRFVVRNNTFHGGNGVLGGYTVGRSNSETLIENNIFYNCDDGSIHKAAAFSDLKQAHNCFWDTNPDRRGEFLFLRNNFWKEKDQKPRSLDLAFRGTEVVADPRFVAPQHGDYRLRPDSPCLGAGRDKADIGAFPQARFYEIRRAPAAVTVDGDFAEWGGVFPMVIDPGKDKIVTIHPKPESWKGPRDFSARARLTWDEQNLYLALDVTDDMPLRDNIFIRDKAPWMSDSLELWLGAPGADRRKKRTANDYKICFSTRREGDVKVTAWAPVEPEEVEAALRRSEAGYRIEARLPFRLIPAVKPEPGAALGLNFHVNDADETGSMDVSLSWSHDPESRSFKDPSVWGVAVLCDAKPPPPRREELPWTAEDQPEENPAWKKLTTLGGREPVLAPGGKTVCFVRFAADKNNLWLTDTAGGEGTQLTREGGVQPTWSPDGKQIAFSSDRTGRDCIWLIDPVGGDLRQLTTDGTGDGFPDFSPDGKQIAYNSYKDGWRVMVVPTSGGTPRALLDTRNARHPDWSPDGLEIAYAWREADHARTEIWVETLATRAKRQVSQDTPAQGTRYPEWSPDGKWIVHVQTTMQPDCRLSIVSADGKRKWRFVDEYHELFDTPCWSADGKLIVCSSKRDATIENVWVLPVDVAGYLKGAE